MSNDKTGATFHGGDLPQRDPLASLASFDRTARPAPVTPPWVAEHERPARRWAWVALAASLAFLVVVLASVARSQNVLPAWVPVIGMDSGVAACKAIHESGGTALKGAAAETGTQTERLAAARELFADSRYPEIKTNGMALMDLAVQMNAVKPGDEMALLPMVGPVTSAYAGLAGECAAHGYSIPPLNR